jgi:hypothetical protein
LWLHLEPPPLYVLIVRQMDVVTQPKLILRVTGEVSVHQAEAG